MFIKNVNSSTSDKKNIAEKDDFEIEVILHFMKNLCLHNVDILEMFQF